MSHVSGQSAFAALAGLKLDKHDPGALVKRVSRPSPGRKPPKELQDAPTNDDSKTTGEVDNVLRELASCLSALNV